MARTGVRVSTAVYHSHGTARPANPPPTLYVPQRPPLVHESVERMVMTIFMLRVWHYVMHYAMSIA